LQPARKRSVSFGDLLHMGVIEPIRHLAITNHS
jgi:hypothetical protein